MLIRDIDDDAYYAVACCVYLSPFSLFISFIFFSSFSRLFTFDVAAIA